MKVKKTENKRIERFELPIESAIFSIYESAIEVIYLWGRGHWNFQCKADIESATLYFN